MSWSLAAYGIVSRTHHFYDDPHNTRLPPKDAYVYGSPARGLEFPKGHPKSWQEKHGEINMNPELEEHDFPVTPNHEKVI